MSRDIKYIGMDVHKEAMVIAVLNGSGKFINNYQHTSVSELPASPSLRVHLSDLSVAAGPGEDSACV
jgi:hypothetical protein